MEEKFGEDSLKTEGLGVQKLNVVQILDNWLGDLGFGYLHPYYLEFPAINHGFSRK